MTSAAGATPTLWRRIICRLCWTAFLQSASGQHHGHQSRPPANANVGTPPYLNYCHQHPDLQRGRPERWSTRGAPRVRTCSWRTCFPWWTAATGLAERLPASKHDRPERHCQRVALPHRRHSPLRTNRAVTPLIPGGSDWKYSDQGLDLGTNWALPQYDDTAWAQGPGAPGLQHSWHRHHHRLRPRLHQQVHHDLFSPRLRRARRPFITPTSTSASTGQTAQRVAQWAGGFPDERARRISRSPAWPYPRSLP